jgi:hypothetical protein
MRDDSRVFPVGAWFQTALLTVQKAYRVSCIQDESRNGLYPTRSPGFHSSPADYGLDSPLLFPLILGGCRPWLRFNCDFHIGALLEAHLMAIFVCQSILNAKLSIEVICPLHCDLGLLRFAGR